MDSAVTTGARTQWLANGPSPSSCYGPSTAPSARPSDISSFTSANPNIPRPIPLAASPRFYTDSATQYSPQNSTPSSTSTSKEARPGKRKKEDDGPSEPEPNINAPSLTNTSADVTMSGTSADDNDNDSIEVSPVEASKPSSLPSAASVSSLNLSAKRPRNTSKPKKKMPYTYEHCDVKDLVQVIAEMLLELIQVNDAIPLQEGRLTRFHSRAPPGISVLDYLQRLTTHATLPSPILLSMVYYIDKLCALYPAFTISSLTVHRFLIASATVASKGLSDSFWTNNTYARVGGITIKELAVLELEFLDRVDWRIVPNPEVLQDYYRNLVERSDDFELDPAMALS